VSDIFKIQHDGIEGYNFVIFIPVQFGNVDGMGHLNNVSYFTFLETARIEYFIHVMEIKEQSPALQDMPFILAAQSINYRLPAFYREMLMVGLRTSWVRRSSFGFDFQMVDVASKRLVAEGNGTHVTFDYRANRTIPVPDEWVARFEAYEGRSLRQPQ